MKTLILLLITTAAPFTSMAADLHRYKVHYSDSRGSGHDTFVISHSSNHARYQVQDSIPGATVTGVFEQQ